MAHVSKCYFYILACYRVCLYYKYFNQNMATFKVKACAPLCKFSVLWFPLVYIFLYSVSGPLSCRSPLLFDLFNSTDAQISTQCK